MLSITEFQYDKINNENTVGTYKLGFAYHSGNFTNYSDSTVNKGNLSIYLIANQYLTKKVGIFSQLGWSPSIKNINLFYASLGFNYLGIGRRINDAFGFAINYVRISEEFSSNYDPVKYPFESAIELFYGISINKNIWLQPDIQYIINPGVFSELSNALVGFVRLNLNF